MAQLKPFKSFVTNMPIALRATQYMVFEDRAFEPVKIDLRANRLLEH